MKSSVILPTDVDIINDDIFSIIGLENIAQDEKDKLLERFGNSIQGRVEIRIFDALSDEKIQELNELLEKEDENVINDFFKAENIDLKTISLEEALIFKSELVALYNNPDLIKTTN